MAGIYTGPNSAYVIKPYPPHWLARVFRWGSMEKKSKLGWGPQSKIKSWQPLVLIFSSLKKEPVYNLRLSILRPMMQ